MKTAIILCSILLLTGCQKPASDASHKTILIKAVGEIEALPDQATFNISLFCLDPSVKAAKDCLVSKSNQLISRLRALGIAKKDILTTSVNMNKSFTWRNNSNVFEGYRSESTLIVTVRKMESLDEIYTELLENGNLELGGLHYKHSDIDSLQNEAYVNALKRSETLANKLLESLPEDKKEVLKIGNVEITSSLSQNRYRGDAMAEQANAGAELRTVGMNPGILRIAATLYVEYKIR